MTARIKRLLVSFLFVVHPGRAQDSSSRAETVEVPLTVESQVPLRVYITKRLHMRKGEDVRAKLIEPVYSFDRVVVPSGVELLGHVTQLDPVSKMERAQAILQGDFTPLHWARVEFTGILMPGGQVIPIRTAASTGLPTIYAVPRPSKKGVSGAQNGGILGTAKRTAQQQIDAKTRDVIDLVRGPNKKEWLEDFLLKKLPYHPQWYRRNTRFDAVLASPMQFGSAAVPVSVLRSVGVPSLDSTAQVRLLTAVSSATADTDTKVQGVLSQPLFSPSHQLLLPEGTLLTGRVRHAQAARWFHRGGQLRFTFDQVEPPAITAMAPISLERKQVQLAAVESDPKASVKVNSEGDAKATEPKTRFIGPVVALLVASRAADNDADRGRLGTPGAAGGNSGGKVLGGAAGFGLLGAVAGRASRTAGVALGYYGLAWSVYSTLISRGREVDFGKNTAMEVRFGSPTRPGQKLGSHLAAAAIAGQSAGR